MGIFADLYRFEGEPPSQEAIERELSARLGEPRTLFEVERNGHDLVVYCGLETRAHDCVLKILSDWGGRRLDFSLRHRPSAFYRYIADTDVHVVDCGGRVDLEVGLARLKVLEAELAARPVKGHQLKLLIDFRRTEWASEDVHRQLSKVTRRDFGLDADNPTTRAAFLDTRSEGAVSPNEHWFLSEAEALAWLTEPYHE